MEEHRFFLTHDPATDGMFNILTCKKCKHSWHRKGHCKCITMMGECKC